MLAPHPSLEKDLDSLDPALVSELAAAGFDRARFLALAATLTEGDAATRRRTRSAVKGEVTPPRPEELGRLPNRGSDEEARLRARGEAALRAGEVAFCTMAGGMATRMGGIVKALCEVFDGHTFLSMRLAENRTVSARAQKPVPLWLMTSHATHEAIEHALRDANAPPHVACFMQDMSLRLNPVGSLFKDDDDKPSVYATGHGDIVDALRRSKLLESFVAGGGRYVWIVNVDNLGAAIDAVVLGRFIESVERTRCDVQCEVCRKEGDKGGIPVHAEGKLQVLEEFRLPPGFDPSSVPVFNTNTFLVRAEPLLRQPLTWTYFEVEKKVSGRPAIQFERLIQEITAQMPTTYLEVSRDGETSRFLPVKDFDELAVRRANIEVVARARGMV
jgi:UTP--glucose-1-phosphate uridylyltransferase